MFACMYVSVCACDACAGTCLFAMMQTTVPLLHTFESMNSKVMVKSLSMGVIVFAPLAVLGCCIRKQLCGTAATCDISACHC
jgi:hypothetical protein